jgi:uncharacterized protein YdeI (YjbR/CyaY-like superfamily)
MEPILKAYIKEAIEVEEAGLDAFSALTPGRQGGYILYFSATKQSKTRQARIEKCLQQILDRKGLNDGSHQTLGFALDSSRLRHSDHRLHL